jgi:ATP-dependent Clp protease ATP-binding subunit ClpA
MHDAMSNEARHVLDAAEGEATALGSRSVAPDHILLALLEARGATGELLAAYGLTRDVVVAGVSRNGNGETRFDPAALATLGIDLEAVRERVEEAFGPGALERTRAGRQLCRERLFSAAAKKALHEAVNAARCEPAEPAHLLLGLILERKSWAATALRDRGVSEGIARAAIDKAPTA